jgi:hypothetical protein
MEKIFNLIRSLGITNPLLILLIGCGVIILIELYFLIRNIRLKNLEMINEKIFSELDTRLEEFYIPLYERFQYTTLIKSTVDKWTIEGIYQNSAVNVESDDPNALRNLVVRKMFLPINADLHDIILNKMHWRDPRDKTDYKFILQHFLLWKTFENAKENKVIRNYEASHILSFPFEEVEKQRKMCVQLLEERENLRNDIRNYKQPKTKKYWRKK